MTCSASPEVCGRVDCTGCDTAPRPATPMRPFPDGVLRIELWHPDSPGGRIVVRPSWLRRLGIVRSEFATLGEARRGDRPRRCTHVNVRCVHGDEIIARGWRRRICLDCGRALRGPLPRVCWHTGKDHLSYVGAP